MENKTTVQDIRKAAIKINRKLRDNEPAWGKVDKTKLPRQAFADVGDTEKVSTWRYPYMWMPNGKAPDENGRYTSGDLYIHKGGLQAAWAAAQGARTGKKASQKIIDTLKKARKAVGLDKDVRKENDIRFDIMKHDAVNRVAIGVVYEPYVVDSQKQWAKPETIQRAAHNFLMSPAFASGLLHDENVTNLAIRKEGKRAVVESYVCPIEMNINGHKVREGSWIMGVKFFDDEEWKLVESGKLNGFSMHGQASG